jgi:hypothetical protein
MARSQARPWVLLVPPLTAFLLSSAGARAGEVQLAPFLGMQYGGTIAPSGRRIEIGVGLQYGATLDIDVTRTWSVELLFARQDTELANPPQVDVAVERYLVGAREEVEVGPGYFLGVGLLGVTRIAADGLGSEARFTLAVGLGYRWPFSRHLGLRADARGYYATASSGSAGLCVNGACAFGFGSSGAWQGDLTGAVVWTF